MNSNIHPTAVIDSQAQLAANVSVGPFSVIGAHVVIGAGTQIGAHSIIEGHTEIGQDNHIGHHVLLGCAPQDKKYAGEPTRLVMGNRNTIREFTSVHTGTAQDNGITQIGDDNWIMGYVHIAHDCVIGNQTILASNAQLAGHVHVQDWAIVGGMAGVHQFVKIGAHAMVGGGSIILKDVVPYTMISGNPSAAYGINSEGLKRRGFSEAQISAIKRAYKTVFRRELTIEQAIEQIEKAAREEGEVSEAIMRIADFLRIAERGIVR